MNGAPRVLLLGGYGAFGTRLARLLARAPDLTFAIAGRNRDSAEAAVRALDCPRASAVGLDRNAVAAVDTYLREQRPSVLIDAAGPYQGRDHRLARQAIAAGVHCIDLADDREFVLAVRALDAEARARDVLVTSGASTVPALSTAIVDWLLQDMDALEAIEIGISPGHRAPRGLATIRSVLSYVGRPIPGLGSGTAALRRGWGGLVRHRYPAPVGKRWLSHVDVPDIALLPERYPGIDSVELRAGLELGVLHLGLGLLGGAVARGWIRDLPRHAPLLARMASAFHPFGSENGAMHVTITGGRDGRRVRRHYELVAQRNDGPSIPATAAAVLAKRLCGCAGYAPLAERGATPCVGLLGLDEFLRELDGLAIRAVQRDEWLDGAR